MARRREELLGAPGGAVPGSQRHRKHRKTVRGASPLFTHPVFMYINTSCVSGRVLGPGEAAANKDRPSP